jgi:hypothetical protein
MSNYISIDNQHFAILSYRRSLYWENNDFFNLRNCGQKSNKELIELCQKYENYTIKPEKIIPENPIEKQIDTLTVRQKKILNNIINSQIRNLSVRAYNSINNYSNSNFSLNSLNELIINQKFNFRNIRNVGKQSEDELKDFFQIIREQIETIQLFENDDELSIELFNSALRRKYNIKHNDINKIWKDYSFDNGLPIFKTIDVLISNRYLFKNKEKEIIKRGFNFWTNSEIAKLEDIGSSLDITRERTRQIRKSMFDEIDSRFSFLNTFEFDALNIYGIDIYADIISIDENLIDEIHQKEHVDFNNIFVTKIISILINKTHSLVGNLESCVFNVVKPKGISYRWKSIYLVKNEIVESFNFEALVIDIKRRISERIDEDYSFHFETYLTFFLNQAFEFESSEIVPIAEHIVFNEFDIAIDLFDNITFKRNTVKQVYEYSYEALKALGVPSKVEVIYKKVKELYPDYNTDEKSIRASMKRKTGFVPFGRTSVYGLKIWEEEKNVRGGTIRDITEEYLIAQNEPKHIDDIEKYVNQFRNTTAKNIYSNLQMEVNSRFVFFRGMYIGIKSKNYESADYEKVENENYERKTWEENYENLFSFVEKHGRLPLNSGITIEKKLYRFLNVQKNRLHKNKLSENKAAKVLFLIEKYPTQRKRRNNNPSKSLQNKVKTQKQLNTTVSEKWWDALNSLKDYLEKNNKYPTAGGNRSLYTFCYNCNKKLENDELSEDQQNALSSINFSFSTGNQNTWWDNFENLKEFLAIENQYPTTSDKKLYTFCYSCQKKLNNGSLNTEQIEALESIKFDFKAGNQHSWEDNFNELMSFYSKNNSWPKYIRTDLMQVRLYRFCMSIFKSYKKNELTKKQLAMLDKIKFPYVNGTFSNGWMNNFEKLKEFRINNPNSWPKARGGVLEKPLYQFCYRNRNKFIDGTLEEYKIQLLNEINFDFYG